MAMLPITVFEFVLGLIATAPIKGSGVGVVNGIFSFPTVALCEENSETKKTPLRIAITRENAAVAKTRVRCFTLAQPTGQSCVITLPSARLIKTHTQPALGIHYQCLGLVFRHAGKIVNIELTIAAKPLAAIAIHFVPIGRTRTRDLDIA